MVLYVDVILHRIIEYNKLMRHFIRQLIVLARRDATPDVTPIRRHLPSDFKYNFAEYFTCHICRIVFNNKQNQNVTENVC